MKVAVFVFTLLLCSPVFCSPAFGGTLRVGTGGEGVYHDGQLRVRDLIETGAEQNPHFGTVADPFYVSRLRAAQLPEGIDARRLAIKLTDFDSLSPHFGQYLLDVLLSYRWSFTGAPLALLPELETISQPVKRVPIANRYMERIVIHRPSWILLPEDDRLALLIHEAVYSLLRPVCAQGPNSCVQSAKRARDITGFGFVSPPRPFSQVTKNDLLLPFEIDACPHRLIELEIGFWIESQKSISAVESRKLDQPLERDKRAAFIKENCAAYMKFAADKPGARLEIRAHRKPYSVRSMIYSNQNNGRQMAQEIFPRAAGFSRFLQPPTRLFCERSVAKLLDDWYEEASSNRIEEAPFCD